MDLHPTGIVEAALAPGRLVPAYQPIVELDTHRVVAFEALARWPGQDGLDPATVFGAAAALDRVAEVDWACRAAAIGAALEADLPGEVSLFVNVEPATLGQRPPAGYEDLLDEAPDRIRVVLELTERALLRDPAHVLSMVSWAHERGWGIAMDDVGAEPASLQFLPFVAPEVVKLDLSLIQQIHGRPQSETMMAVLAHVEETGAVLLAEGIETEAHLEQALSLGAQYGQGWAFGRPGPLEVTGPVASLPEVKKQSAPTVTPFDLVEDSPRLRRSPKGLLLGLTYQLERRAVSPHEPAILLAAFQHRENFTAPTALRYEQMVQRLPFVAAFAEGMDVEPVPGVRGARLEPGDPLIGEWTVVVIGPHYAGALIARDCGEDVADLDRHFDYVLTHQREVVLRAGRSLMSRIVGADAFARN
ncbi:EAL domain-containing protein [Nocardioides mangrovicus]|uniref:EAL domain-containing protein n=1 Tax=Nocardioides mangrovicus TaxID=2478913 RepID=A0A3L8P551_9ACTN|nr:EAL domain-containing protein [Nocardioides mangrovicus]RLV50172.1 EAL domain-containing protein [Nocardioides mangrovicus]